MDFRAFLDTRSLEQLKEINNVVVGKINTMEGAFRPAPMARSAVTAALAKFKVGDLVEFNCKRGIKHTARIKSVNAKTATCIEDLGRKELNPRWRVSPSFLRLVGEHTEAPTATPAPAPAMPSAWPGLSATAAPTVKDEVVASSTW